MFRDAEEWWSFDDAAEWSKDHHSAASSGKLRQQTSLTGEAF
jgi:hypothetical protein